MDSRERLAETSTEAAAVAWETADGLGRDIDGALARTVAAGLNGIRCAILAAIAEPERPAVLEAPPPPLAGWGHLELLGHRQVVGWIEEDDFVGRRVLRVRSLREADRKPGVGEPKPPLELEDAWRIYSPAAVYSFQPLDEADARAFYLGRNHTDDIPF